MVSEDQAAIDRVLAGDSSAYAELVERHQQRLLGLLWHSCGCYEEAEDIAQEAFARAYHKLNLYSGESLFYTWLCRVALNLLISQKRRKRIENQLPREGFEGAVNAAGMEHSSAEEMEKSELRACVRQAVAMLDVERRTVVLLRDFDGMDYDTIAEVLEIPVGTVRSRLHRARLELKTILQQRLGQLDLTP